MQLFTNLNFTKSACNETAAVSCDASVSLQNEDFARLYNGIDDCIEDLTKTTESTNVKI